MYYTRKVRDGEKSIWPSAASTPQQMSDEHSAAKFWVRLSIFGQFEALSMGGGDLLEACVACGSPRLAGVIGFPLRRT
jgi:hypothetical protein